MRKKLEKLFDGIANLSFLILCSCKNISVAGQDDENIKFDTHIKEILRKTIRLFW